MTDRDRPTADGTSVPPEPRPRAVPSILQNVGTLMTSKLTNFLVTMGLGIVVAQFVVPADLAGLRLALSVWLIGQSFVTLGTSTYVVLQTANDESFASDGVGPVIAVRLAAWSLTAVGMAVVMAVLRPDGELVVLLALIGLAIAVDSVTDVLVQALAGLQQIGGPAVIATVLRLVLAIGVVVALASGGGVRAYASVTLAVNVLTLVFVHRYFARYGRIRFARTRERATLAIRGSFVFLLTAVVLTLYQQIDTILIALLVDRTALGWYAAIDGLFSSLMFIPSVVLASIFPVMGRLHGEGQTARLHDLVTRTFSSFLLLSIPMGAGVMIIGRNLAPLMYGDDYAPSGQILVAFGPSIALIYGTTLIGFVATAIGRQLFWLKLMSVAVLVEVGLEFVLVPWADRQYGNGAVGGALVYVVTEGLMLVVGVRVIAPYVLGVELGRRAVKVAVATLAMTAVAWPLRDAFVAVPVVAGAVVYCVAVLVLRTLRADERQIVDRSVKATRSAIAR